MKFLIAGFGSIGRRHFRNLLALGQRDILLYRSGHSTLPDDEIAGFTVENSLEAALAQRPDAVIVANPTALHLDVAIPAAKAGCDILLEKPISHSLERVDELEAAAWQAGVKVLVGFQYRFHAGMAVVRQVLSEGSLGKITSVHAHYGEWVPGWHPWEDYRQSYSGRRELGGGVVLTLSHPLDYLRWLFGPVSGVWAFTSQGGGLGLDVEDTAEIGLRFASGMTGTVHLDYIQRPTTRTLEVIGENGTLRWDDVTGATSLFLVEPDAASPVDAGWKHFPPPPNFDRNDMFLAEMRHFLEVISGQADPVCSLDDGRRSLQLALAVSQSAALGALVRL